MKDNGYHTEVKQKLIQQINNNPMTPAEATEHAKLYIELLNARELLHKIKEASKDSRQKVRLTSYYTDKIDRLTESEA